MIACPLPRPTNDDDVGPRPGQRPLMLLQTWAAQGGVTGELVVEPHREHMHVWWRWDQDWSSSLAGDEDWDHFRACVRPVVCEVVEAFRCCSPLTASSAELLA